MTHDTCAVVPQSLPVLERSSSRTFSKWKDVPLPICNYIYLFNITNVHELLSGASVPVVQEIGRRL